VPKEGWKDDGYLLMEIKTVAAKAADVAEVIDMIAEATDQEDEDVVMLACLGTAVLIQDPEVKPEKFLEILQSTSEFIALQLATTSGVMN
jgi:hypothetical protein